MPIDLRPYLDTLACSESRYDRILISLSHDDFKALIDEIVELRGMVNDWLVFTRSWLEDV